MIRIRVAAVFLSLILFSSLVRAQEAEYETLENISYYKASDIKDNYQESQCKLDIYYPKNKKNYVTVVWLHGGGLTEGNKHIPEELKNKGVAIVPIGYRLSPKVKHPAYIEDSATGVAWVKDSISKYGGDPNKVIVAGHSAGGYLALMLALDKSYLKKHNVDADNIMMYFPLSGQCTTHYTVRKEMNLPQDKWWIDEYSPIFHIRSNTAPIVLTTGGRHEEMALRYEENLILKKNAERFKNDNVKLYELQGFDHGTMVNPGLQLLLNLLKGKI